MLRNNIFVLKLSQIKIDTIDNVKKKDYKGLITLNVLKRYTEIQSQEFINGDCIF